MICKKYVAYKGKLIFRRITGDSIKFVGRMTPCRVCKVYRICTDVENFRTRCVELNVKTNTVKYCGDGCYTRNIRYRGN